MEKPIENTKTSVQKPQWLEALEAQSWQAELLVSSVIVFFLTRLPDDLLRFLEAYALSSSEISFGFLKFGSVYFMGGIYAMIFIFGLHFLIRALWIALLGLNSVYPKGIVVKAFGSLSENYMRRMKQDFPSLSAYNEKLDNTASTLFSQAAMVVMIFSSFGFLIFFSYLLFRLLGFIFPNIGDYTLTFAIIMYALFLLWSLAFYFIGKTKYFSKEKLEDLQFKINSKVSKFVYTIFYTPLTYITNILSTNSTSKYGFLYGMAISAFLGFIAIMKMDSSPIFDNFGYEEYFEFNNIKEVIHPYNYEDMLSEETPIFTAVIPSQNIYGKQVQVFIPTIEREEDKINYCEDLPFLKRIKRNRKETRPQRIARRDSIRTIDLNAVKDFNKIYVNETFYDDLKFQYFTHPHQSEEGILVYIPTQNFKVGENILEIRKEYFSDEGVQKIVHIPFFFEGE